MTRLETFAFLQDKGFEVVPNGIVSEFVPAFIQGIRTEMGVSDEPAIRVTDNINEAIDAIDIMARKMQRDTFERICRVVVYTDPDKRGGEGIELMDAFEALQKYPEHYCSQYRTYTMDDSGFSKRILAVGTWVYVLESASDDWRSHNGNSQTAVTFRTQAERKRDIPYPIYAVDMIGEPMKAIDFDTNPSLEIINRYITQDEIDKEVENFLQMLNDTTPQPTHTS